MARGLAHVDDRHAFSLTGSTIAVLGNAIVLPADWSPAVRAVLSFLGAVFVGVIVPMLQRAAKDWMDGRLKLRELADENAELKAEVRRLRDGATLLGPPKATPPGPDA